VCGALQDCLRHCHEQIESAVRDSVCPDVSSEESSPSSDAGDDNRDNDDDDAGGRQSKAAAVHLPSTPTDVRDISLVNNSEQQSSAERLWLHVFHARTELYFCKLIN